jgi:guanosine-3',5'-bis(diphosphate) 3'-pyrophosphohydrolase
VESDRNDALPLLLDALNFAALRHRAQRRKGRDGAPYVNHLIEVANILAHHGIRDVDVLRAAVLHDAVEDAGVTIDEVRDRFGRPVARWVSELTDDVNLPVWKRKLAQIEGAPHLSAEGQTIRVADKISNLRGILTSPPTSWSLERKVAYYGWARQVVDGCEGAPEALRATFGEVHAVGLVALYAARPSRASLPPPAPAPDDLLVQLEKLDPIGSIAPVTPAE